MLWMNSGELVLKTNSPQKPSRPQNFMGLLLVNSPSKLFDFFGYLVLKSQ